MCTANVSCLSYIRNEKNCKKQRRQTFLDDLSLWGVGFWEDESRKLLGLFFTLLYSRILCLHGIAIYTAAPSWCDHLTNPKWVEKICICFALKSNHSHEILYFGTSYLCLMQLCIFDVFWIRKEKGQLSVFAIERPQIDHNGSKLIRHALQRCHDLKIIFWTSSLLSHLLPK